MPLTCANANPKPEINLNNQSQEELQALLENYQSLLATHERLIQEGKPNAVGVLEPPTVSLLSGGIIVIEDRLNNHKNNTKK